MEERIWKDYLQNIETTPSAYLNTAAHVISGKTFLPQQQILLYSADEWEEFIKEWAHFLKTKYEVVKRLGGAGDMGIDIAAFTDKLFFEGVWDCYQCKHYDDPLTPSTAIKEVGKVLWYSFNKEYSPPRKYYFVAPKECGMKLERLFETPLSLKKYLIENWEKNCKNNITSKKIINLDGLFANYVDSFDFSIFSSYPILTILEEYKKTPFYSMRFGGGLPQRSTQINIPLNIKSTEIRYIAQLHEVYSENLSKTTTDISDLNDILKNHFNRQREFFYNAESLKNFSRDSVPTGTYEQLQNEIFDGLIDHSINNFPSGLERLNSITQEACKLQITSNPLISVVKQADRKGICHQLANMDRLKWIIK